MPSLLDSYSGPFSRPSFLNNRIESSSPFGQAAQLSQMETEAMTRRLFNSKYQENRGETFYSRIGKYAAASAIDLGDTLMSNELIPGNPIERGDVWNFVGDYGPLYGPQLKDFYERNQSGVELLSGVAGAVGMGYVAGSLVLPRVASALANSTAISSSRLWQSGARINAASRANMLAAQRQAAAEGNMYRMYKSAGLRFLGNEARNKAGVALFEEAAIVATLNSNEAVWSDEVSTNLAWAGLGIGLGGALGVIQGRAAARQFANSDEMLDLRRNAIDQQKIAELRERNPELFQLGMKDARAKISTEITLLSLEARQANPINATSQVNSRMDPIRSQAEQQVQIAINKSAVQGVPDVENTRFRADDSAGRHIHEATKRDPFILHGMDHMGTLSKKTADESLKIWDDKTADLMKSKEGADVAEGKRRASLQRMVIIGGKALPADVEDVRKLANYRPNPADFKPVVNTAGFQFNSFTSGTKIMADESFSIVNMGMQKRSRLHLGDLEVDDRLRAIDALKLTMSKMAQQRIGHKIAKDADWEQIDSAIYFQKQMKGEVDWSALGVKNADEAEILSLKKKAEAARGKDIGSPWERLALNLEEPTATARMYDSKGDTFRAILDAAEAGAPLDQLKILKKQLDEGHGFRLYGADEDVQITGNMFDYNRDSKGNWQDPVLAFYTTPDRMKKISAEGLEEWDAEAKIAQFQDMTRQGNKIPRGFITPMLNHIVRMPEYAPSQSIIGLSDDQVTGTGSFIRQAVGEIVTREMKSRDNVTMLSIIKTAEEKNRFTDRAIREMIETHLGDTPARLASSTNAGSKALVDQFMTFAYGKNLKSREVDNGDGTFSFELADTGNKAAHGQGVKLYNHKTGKPVVVDRLGLSFLKGFNRISQEILADQNRVRAARGVKPLRQKPWYVPSPDTKGKKIAFVFDAQKNVIRGKTIMASTQTEFDDLIAKAHASLPAGHVILTREAVESSIDMFDRAAMDWIDPNITAKPATTQTGNLGSERINPHSISDSLAWIKDSMETIGTDAFAALYKSQISIAKIRGATEQVTRGLKPQGFAGRQVDARVRTIWDEYQAVIYGKTLGELDKSISGSIVRPIEAFANGAIAAAWPAVRHMAPSQLVAWLNDTSANMGVAAPKSIANAKSTRGFNNLVTQLGPHVPFNNAMEYAEQTLKVVRPPEIRAIAQSLNKLSASLLLRYFELPHAAMNLIGMITTMPSIVRSGKAPISSFFNTPTGRIGTVDGMKILMQATKDMMSDQRMGDWIEMVRNGDATQQVAEFNIEMSLIKDRSSFDRFFFGKGAKLGAKNPFSRLWNEKGVDGYISIATDTTENWSRGWAHFVGLRMADAHGITGKEARHAFAREIANASIANYSPMNRPELFQSAFGSMFGLFMSWMQSYNQRLFRWAEHGQYKDIARQLAYQSALFGIASNPGYDQVSNLLMNFGVGDNVQGQDATMTDNIYAKFGPLVGTTIAHGGLQELGAVLYTRGDMNYRDVSIDPARLMAGVSVMGTVANAFKESAETLFSSYSVEESGRLSEVIARNMPNRVMKGTLSVLFNGGDEIDNRGQLVSENIDFLESATRMLGLRSQRQQAEIEAFYTNRQLQDREAARMDVLRHETRSLIRNPGWEDKLQGVFDKYVKNGGRPDHFRTWIQDQVRAAEGTRGLNQMRKAMANPKNQDEVWRYNIYGGQ